MITALDKVRAIRDTGYRVRISHNRRVHAPRSSTPMRTLMTAHSAAALGWEVMTHGGETEVTITVDTGTEVVLISEGVSRCSDADLFDKRWGLELAVRRAIKEAPELRMVMKELAAARAAA